MMMLSSVSRSARNSVDARRFKGFAVRAEHGGSLDTDILREAVPSLFSVSQSAHLSARYAQIPTYDVMQGLRRDGWEPTFAAQAKARDESGREHTKHMVRLRPAGQNILNVDVPELVLFNSHDGTSAFRLLAGMFRKICTNGLVVGDFSGCASVPHRGNVIDGVREGAVRIGREMADTLPLIEDMRTTSLDYDERRLLARHALALRFEEGVTADPDQALRAHRSGDHSRDLWTTFNVVQESIIRGGLTATRVDEHGKRRQQAARAIGSVDRDLRLNSSLFALAREFHALKRGTSTLIAEAA